WDHHSCLFFFFFSSRRRHTRWPRDWSSDVCSSDLPQSREARQGIASDRQYFPPYQCVPVVRSDTLARFPRLREVLGELAGKLTRSEERRVGKECRDRWRRGEWKR